MRLILRVTFASVVAVAAAHAPLIHVSTDAVAQQQAPTKQIQLTEKQVQGFVASQKEMSPVLDRIKEGKSDEPDPNLEAQLEAIAQKNGFEDMDEYDLVADNISMVMAGIDPTTKTFTESQIEKEIEEVTADDQMSEKDKKEALEELSEALKTAKLIQFPSNIELVKKYYDQIDRD